MVISPRTHLFRPRKIPTTACRSLFKYDGVQIRKDLSAIQRANYVPFPPDATPQEGRPEVGKGQGGMIVSLALDEISQSCV